MGTAFQISDEDVANVLTDQGQSADDAAMLLLQLDHAAVEKAALEGDDLDQQAEYAREEIRRQLAELGALPSAPAP